MPKKYVVQLEPNERKQAEQLLRKGKASTHTLTHARILLKADSADERKAWTDEAIHAAFDVSLATIQRVRRLYVTQGFDKALQRKPPARARARRLDGAQEAHLIALACSPAPQGHDHWTMRLLAEKMVTLEYAEELSHETVRRTLKKMNLNRG
jgi:transposase